MYIGRWLSGSESGSHAAATAINTASSCCGVDVDDDAPLATYRTPDPRVAAYSTVYLEGQHLRSFKFSIRPKYIRGQAGAGEDSKLKIGAFVKLSFAWQAFTCDQPNQQLLPLHRAI